VPEPGRPREQVKNHGRVCTQVLSLCRAELNFFRFLEIMTSAGVKPSAGRYKIDDFLSCRFEVDSRAGSYVCMEANYKM